MVARAASPERECPIPDPVKDTEIVDLADMARYFAKRDNYARLEKPTPPGFQRQVRRCNGPLLRSKGVRCTSLEASFDEF